MAITYNEYTMPVVDKSAEKIIARDENGEPIMIQGPARKDGSRPAPKVKMIYPMSEQTIQLVSAERLEDWLELQGEGEGKATDINAIINLAMHRRQREVTARGGNWLAVGREEREEEEKGLVKAKELKKRMAELQKADPAKLAEVLKLLGIEA